MKVEKLKLERKLQQRNENKEEIKIIIKVLR